MTPSCWYQERCSTFEGWRSGFLYAPSVVEVERVDFVSFQTQDIARARRFYAETLGLVIERENEHDIEFRAGQVTLDIFDPHERVRRR